MNEEVKCIEELARTTGKGIDLANKVGSFIARLTEGSLTQGIGMFEDKLKYVRWERQVRLMKRAEEFMRDSGISEITTPIPFKLAIPLLQGASLEEDDNLQDMWAKLLVNAVSNKGIVLKRIYIDILERLSPLEVKILDKIYSLPFNENRYKMFASYMLPDSISVRSEDNRKYPELNNQEVELALMNLDRIGCISTSTTISGGENYSHFNLTYLGNQFYKACTL